MSTFLNVEEQLQHFKNGQKVRRKMDMYRAEARIAASEALSKLISDRFSQLREARKKLQMTPEQVILAVDFDGTICTAEYPEIGREREGAKEFINKLYDEGYAIIINTCRSDEGPYRAAEMAKEFLRIRGIKYHAFNENLPHLIEHYGCDTRKISADVYIDDKCMFEIPSWEQKYRIIKSKYPNPKDKNEKSSLVKRILTTESF